VSVKPVRKESPTHGWTSGPQWIEGSARCGPELCLALADRGRWLSAGAGPVYSDGADFDTYRCGRSPACVERHQCREERQRTCWRLLPRTGRPLIELEEKELRRMEEDFMKQGSVLSANAKREREEQFRRRMSEYQQKVTDLNREVQDKQKEVLDGFREKD
jgi:hypothetical protein